MKLGMSYNVFDGVELLEFGIKEHRDVTERINVVYQTTSNYGDKLPYDDRQTKLLDDGLIDKIIMYEPDLSKTPKQNETIKRNLGFDDLRTNGCDYSMTMDCDEIYFKEDLVRGLDKMIEQKLDISYVNNIRYYKYPTHQLVNHWGDLCPFMYKSNCK